MHIFWITDSRDGGGEADRDANVSRSFDEACEGEETTYEARGSACVAFRTDMSSR